MDEIKLAAEILKNSKYAVAFTGAGISVESGIPPFRGSNGIWNKYEEKLFDIDYFSVHTKEAWDMLCDGFYKTTLNAQPNAAHFALAELEKRKIIKAVITQNIDGLHTKAGSLIVYELHGSGATLTCMSDGSKYQTEDFDLNAAPVCKKCGKLLKPDFTFFGEQLPQEAYQNSVAASSKCDVMLLVGSTGTVYPAASIPQLAKQHGAKIIEINPSPSSFTNSVSDIFIPLKAGEAFKNIMSLIP
ncbi:MAG: NAD-dependent deacylase [Endomicrobium sp.]|jgi:NAD-dependent deacetylase|nr:NAD-dependent deacylase [Endomicrobium sp.]